MNTRIVGTPIHRLIHGRYWGWVMKEEDALCNAYCRNGEHCTLIYSAPTTDVEALQEYVAETLHIPVVRMELAREAPPPKDLDGFYVGAPDDTSAGTGWLVFWK